MFSIIANLVNDTPFLCARFGGKPRRGSSWFKRSGDLLKLRLLVIKQVVDKEVQIPAAGETSASFDNENAFLLRFRKSSTLEKSIGKQRTKRMARGNYDTYNCLAEHLYLCLCLSMNYLVASIEQLYLN